MMDRDTTIAGLQAELEQARMRINELEVRLEGFVNAARIEANAVAIRQREACARALWDYPLALRDFVRSTPLVTETK
jgi:hypothetical protein